MRRLQLQELLHVANYRLPDTQALKPATANGTKRKSCAYLNIKQQLGLPAWIPRPTQMAVFRKIRSMTAGSDPLLVWKEPVTIHAQMKVTLRDYYALPEDPQSLQTLVLRSACTYQGCPAQDCIKVLVESDVEDSSIYFAQCLAFVQDANDDYFAIVRWFEGIEENGFNPITHVPSFRLAQENKTNSYCILPAFSILNGAVMVPGTDNRYWALLSPKEERNYTNQFLMN